jgi:hypothetical protein
MEHDRRIVTRARRATGLDSRSQEEVLRDAGALLRCAEANRAAKNDIQTVQTSQLRLSVEWTALERYRVSIREVRRR